MAASDGPDEPDGGDAPARLPVALTEEARAELAERAADRHDWIGEPGAPTGRRRAAPTGARPTSAPAPPIPTPRRCRTETGGTRLGYHDHYVVDGGKARIILTALVTPAEVQENQPALDLLWRARFRWKLRPRQVTGDTKYGTVENIVAIEGERHPRLRPAVGGRPAGPGCSASTDFVYDAAADTYRCPGRPDAALPLAVRDDAAADLPGPSRRPAPPARSGPSARPRSEAGASAAVSTRPYLDRVRGYHATEPYAKAMRKRQVWVEPLFAEAKDWHGLRRFRLRGLEKVNGEALLIAAGQNLKRLLSRRGWGRRPFPSGAAGVVLPALPPAAGPDAMTAALLPDPVQPAARHRPACPLFQHAGSFSGRSGGFSFSRALRMCGALRTRPRIIVPFSPARRGIPLTTATMSPLRSIGC